MLIRLLRAKLWSAPCCRTKILDRLARLCTTTSANTGSAPLQLKSTLTQVYLTQRSRKYLLSRPDRTASPCAAPARCDPRARSPRSLLISARTESALKCTALSRRARTVASVVFPAPGNPSPRACAKLVSLYLIGDNSWRGFHSGKNP